MLTKLCVLFAPSTAGGVHDHEPTHITAILGESVIFNCHVEFPGDHPVPYVLQWEKKVSETVRNHQSFSHLLTKLVLLPPCLCVYERHQRIHTFRK